MAAMKRALVLGGGGPVGIAWETGLALGLRDAGIDLREADCIVGTSAGSIVGARLAAGHDVDGPPPGGRLALPATPGGPDREAIARIFALWGAAGTPEALRERRREIAQLACAARTPDEAAWIAATGGPLGLAGWPRTPLRISALDVERDERVLLDAASGVPIERAVAASCAVPGLYPPVVIEGRRHLDGGLASGTSADAAARLPEAAGAGAPDFVLVVAPMCAPGVAIHAAAGLLLEAEVAALRAAGIHVAVVTPDADDVRAFGPNLLDPSRFQAVRDRGRERGRALARGEAAPWRS